MLSPKKKGNGSGTKKSGKTPKTRPASKKDTISPYYATQKYGTSFEKSTAKTSMKGYFSGSAANTRKESEGQHMSRMSKRDTIPSARKSRGYYGVGGSKTSMSKSGSVSVKKKR